MILDHGLPLTRHGPGQKPSSSSMDCNFLYQEQETLHARTLTAN